VRARESAKSPSAKISAILLEKSREAQQLLL